MSTPPARMNDTAAILRTWLMHAPRPAQLRIYAKDGREYEVTIKQGTAWSETAVSVAALEPERLEAYSAENKLVRAVTVADLLRKEETTAAQQAATFSAMQTTDPETQRMIVFAELLERAYAKAYEASQSTVAVAFTQLQEICGSLAQQANSSTQSANELSVAIRNLLVQQAQEAIEHAAAPELSPMEQMAANFMSGQHLAAAQEQAAAPATNGKTNGKANGKTS